MRALRPLLVGIGLLAMLSLCRAGEEVPAVLEVFESAEPERIATGYRFTEGPVWSAAGYLLFSDIPANRIYQWTPDGNCVVFREPSGNSNGLLFDRQARLLACEHGNRRVSRTEKDGRVVALAERYEGKRLNSPNDLVVRSDGVLFFTDPPYGIKPEEKEQPVNGVYRLDPDGTLTLLAGDFDRPNGLALSPDEKVLYVADCSRSLIRAFDVAADGSVANSRIVCEMPREQRFTPDGMKVDARGNLYVTGGASGLWVFRPGGQVLARVAFPEGTANCAFGGPDGRSLFVTASKSVYRLRTRVPGNIAR